MRPISEIKANPKQFIGLTSLKLDEFENILSVFVPLWENYYKHHDLKGANRKLPKFKEDIRSSLFGTELKLFFLLYCLKNNGLQEHNAFAFDMTQSKLSQWLKCLLPILEQTLKKLNYLPARTQEELDKKIGHLKEQLFWVDASEREIPRPQDKDTQKATFSGKTHMNAAKNTLICQENQKIVFLGMTQEGSIHDLTMLREDEISLPKNSVLFQDLGYLGHKPEDVFVIMPEKKPKGKELNPIQKQNNTLISSCRVLVEHAIAGIKRIRSVLDEIRLRTNDIVDKIMLIACGIHNLRVNFRASYKLS
jgi:hypothetical protein